jgi:hypothetical protein
MAAARAGDNRVSADGAAAVSAEMRAPRDRRAAVAGRGCSARHGDRVEHRVKLVQALLERDDLAALLDQQLVPKVRASVHLERQPAEVADSLLARLDDDPSLAAQSSRRRGSSQRRGRGCPLGFAGPAPKAI